MALNSHLRLNLLYQKQKCKFSKLLFFKKPKFIKIEG